MDPNYQQPQQPMQPQQQYYGYSAPGAEDPKKKMIIKIVLFLSAVFIGLIMLYAGYLRFFTTPSLRPELVKLAAYHYEMSRVADIIVDSNVARESSENLAAILRVNAVDNQRTITAVIKSEYGESPTSAELKSEFNGDIDDALESAELRNNLDEEFEIAAAALLASVNAEAIKIIGDTDNEEVIIALNEIASDNQILLESLSSN